MPSHHRRDAVAFDVLHRRAILPVNLARPKHLRNVLPRQRQRHLALRRQRLHKLLRPLAQRRKALRLQRYHLVRLRVQRLIDVCGIRLRDLALNFKSAKHRRHFESPPPIARP